MKIFYAIQATGNISRATQLYPYLKKYGLLTFFSVETMQLYKQILPIKYKSKGCSLHYSKCGGLNYWDIVKILNQDKFRDADTLPLKV
jgi:hypothetical protein